MKKLVSILCIILFVTLPLFANNNFDKTNNYQGKNAYNYLGERLMVIGLKDLSGKTLEETFGEQFAYVGFMTEDFMSESFNNGITTVYQWQPNGFAQCIGGTEPEYLRWKCFEVIEVVPYEPNIYNNMYLFTLYEYNYKFKCKYIYNGNFDFVSSYYDFPFITFKHLQWLADTFVNNKIVYATNSFWTEERGYFDHHIINSNGGYSNGGYKNAIVNNITYNDDETQFVFELDNGEQVPIAFVYNKNPIAYNTLTKVFLYEDWIELKEKYSKQHMDAIMNGNILKGMSTDELLLSVGKGIKRKSNNKIQRIYTLNPGLVYVTIENDIVTNVEIYEYKQSNIFSKIKQFSKKLVNKLSNNQHLRISIEISNNK